MAFLILCFWICLALTAYVYVLYPLFLALLAQLRKRPLISKGGSPRSVSVVLAAYNEELNIDRRIRELKSLLEGSGLKWELIVVSDGSTDGTAEIARRHAGNLVRIIELNKNLGKATALTEGVRATHHQILVFADSRQRWDKASLSLLLENFADPTVGAVSGDLVLETGKGVLAGVGFYWQFEKWLRQQESRVHSLVQVTGAICAVRRELFQPVPRGTILDDVYWAQKVAMQGHRVVHDSRAKAYDCLPDKAGTEFQRKVRTLTGNFQLLTVLPSAFLPWRNPIWLQLISHKLARLAIPWALLGMCGTSAVIPDPGFQLFFWMQCAFYMAGLAGIWTNRASRFPLVATAGAFLVMNAAAWVAFWMWISGRSPRVWTKTYPGEAFSPSYPGTS